MEISKLNEITNELDIPSMTKVEAMDRCVNSFEYNIKSTEIIHVIKDVFGIDLEAISVLGDGIQSSLYDIEIKEGVAKQLRLDPKSTEFKLIILNMTKVDVMDTYMKGFEKEVTGPEIRRMINLIFGLNLDAISSLEHAGITVFSKGQCILQKETDLFVVSSGKGDVDIKIYQTSYFTKKTGLKQLPIELQESLINLGFQYNPEFGAYYYATPTGESLPESTKIQIFSALVKVIQNSYSNL